MLSSSLFTDPNLSDIEKYITFTNFGSGLVEGKITLYIQGVRKRVSTQFRENNGEVNISSLLGNEISNIALSNLNEILNLSHISVERNGVYLSASAKSRSFSNLSPLLILQYIEELSIAMMFIASWEKEKNDKKKEENLQYKLVEETFTDYNSLLIRIMVSDGLSLRELKSEAFRIIDSIFRLDRNYKDTFVSGDTHSAKISSLTYSSPLIAILTQLAGPITNSIHDLLREKRLNQIEVAEQELELLKEKTTEQKLTNTKISLENTKLILENTSTLQSMLISKSASEEEKLAFLFKLRPDFQYLLDSPIEVEKEN